VEENLMKNYDALLNEVDCIHRAWGYDFLSALNYIGDHAADYYGTRVWNEYLAAVDSLSDSLFTSELMAA
jgi:hypothetical protein